MCYDVENQRTVVLSTNINQNGFNSSATLQLPSGLSPDWDEIIVKQVAFHGTTPDALLFVWCDLTGSSIANIMCSGSSHMENCNIPINVTGKVIPNTITFNLMELSTTNTLISTPEVGLFSINLSFVKYL